MKIVTAWSATGSTIEETTPLVRLVSWHDVFENGYVSGGYATRGEAGEAGAKRLLRLELDPDTLDVISAKTEAP